MLLIKNRNSVLVKYLIDKEFNALPKNARNLKPFQRVKETFDMRDPGLEYTKKMNAIRDFHFKEEKASV